MITSGTILIDRSALRPQVFQLDDAWSANAWTSVRHSLTPHELEKQLSIAGWTFFYMAGAIRTRVFGFDRAKMLGEALKRLIKNVKLQKCNCLQIEGMAMRSFLGVPYMSISAHPRHIQKGLVFVGQ